MKCLIAKVINITYNTYPYLHLFLTCHILILYCNNSDVVTALFTMATVCHKSYISLGRNFNNIIKYNVLSSNFGGYLKLTKSNLRTA